ncbi:MAG: amidohydrolase [Bacteroidales bacterium]|nr:amidohydrolase [Bacteroidales bacterium]MCF8404061.1 amidohydrolase [Bacteroidales bacterium]
MDHLISEIKEIVSDLFMDIVEIRRTIHANPELAFEEYKTARLIENYLAENDIEFTSGIAKTGVVGLIKGKNPDNKVIALRADMDALPIVEKNSVDYKSKNEGKMHACGHDVHTASLLGAAKILNQLKDKFEGTVKLIFQPSEEKYPGGAKVMISEGVLENPSVNVIFGQHVYPELEAGKVGMRSGKYMASTDEIFLTIIGKGGHGAIPHKNIDPVLIASHIVVAMQQIVSRNSNPAMPTVLSFGRIIGEGQTNVIPDEVKLSGIMRTFDENWREEMKTKIRDLAENLAKSMGGKCIVKFDTGYPFLVNDIVTTERAWISATEYLGTNNVVPLEMRTTAEDFAYFAQKIPACFYRIGTRNEAKGINSNLHTATFDVDEESIKTGMGLMAWIAINELKDAPN